MMYIWDFDGLLQYQFGNHNTTLVITAKKDPKFPLLAFLLVKYYPEMNLLCRNLTHLEIQDFAIGEASFRWLFESFPYLFRKVTHLEFRDCQFNVNIEELQELAILPSEVKFVSCTSHLNLKVWYTKLRLGI